MRTGAPFLRLRPGPLAPATGDGRGMMGVMTWRVAVTGATRRGPGRPADGGDRRTANPGCRPRAVRRQGLRRRDHARHRPPGRRGSVARAPLLRRQGAGSWPRSSLPCDPTDRCRARSPGTPLSSASGWCAGSSPRGPTRSSPPRRRRCARRTGEPVATMLREFLRREILHRVATSGDAADAELRAELADRRSGIMVRYVLAFEPLASPDDESRRPRRARRPMAPHGHPARCLTAKCGRQFST